MRYYKDFQDMHDSGANAFMPATEVEKIKSELRKMAKAVVYFAEHGHGVIVSKEMKSNLERAKELLK